MIRNKTTDMMKLDLLQYDLEGLHILYNIYRNRWELAANKLSKDGNGIHLLDDEVLAYKELEASVELEIIGAEIINRTKDKLNWSREELFRNFGIGNKFIQVNFIPSSNAYQQYGPNVHVSLHYPQNELLEIVNLMKDPNSRTDGAVYFEVVLGDDLSKRQIQSLKEVGVMSSEIDKVVRLITTLSKSCSPISQAYTICMILFNIRLIPIYLYSYTTFFFTKKSNFSKPFNKSLF